MHPEGRIGQKMRGREHGWIRTYKKGEKKNHSKVVKKRLWMKKKYSAHQYLKLTTNTEGARMGSSKWTQSPWLDIGVTINNTKN